MIAPYLKNEYIKAVYTDNKKYFDSASHKRLLKILSQYKLNESFVN